MGIGSKLNELMKKRGTNANDCSKKSASLLLLSIP